MMKKIVGFTFSGIGMGVALMASARAPHFAGPEIDPASGRSALALLAGILVLIRGRRKRQSR